MSKMEEILIEIVNELNLIRRIQQEHLEYDQKFLDIRNEERVMLNESRNAAAERAAYARFSDAMEIVCENEGEDPQNFLAFAMDAYEIWRKASQRAGYKVVLDSFEEMAQKIQKVKKIQEVSEAPPENVIS